MSTKFTPETRAILLEALQQNPSIYSAAAKANVTYRTVMRWLERGQQGDEGGFVEFLADVEVARSQMKDEIVQSLFEIATDRLHPQAVKAAKELLTALYPREFSPVRHVITHQAKEPEMDLTSLTSDEIRVFVKTLKKVQADNEPGTPRMLPDALPVIDVVSQPKASKNAN